MEKCNSKELYEQHRNRLLSLIQSKVQDSQNAEDILHDSFVKLETCCQNECECEQPKSYLFKIAMNTVMDFFKRNKKKKSIENSIEPNSSNTSDKREDNSMACDLYECIYQNLNRMTPENREAYILVDIEEIPQKEVAERMGIPFSTLKSRVQRTRKALKKEIEHCCQNPQIDCI